MIEDQSEVMTDMLYSAMVQCSLESLFVKTTENVNETVMYFDSITKMMQKKYMVCNINIEYRFSFLGLYSRRFR